MGLFNRDEKAPSETLYDTLALAGNDQLDSDYFEPDEPSASFNPAMNAPILNNNINYGIEDAIELMRRLPKEHSELVVSVVKETLESTQVSIADIIADADNKSAQIRDRNNTLEQEIADLRAQINEREEYIDELQANLNETLTVREKLQLSVDQAAAAAPAQTFAQPTPQAAPQPVTQSATQDIATATTAGDAIADIPSTEAPRSMDAGHRKNRHANHLPH